MQSIEDIPEEGVVFGLLAESTAASQNLACTISHETIFKETKRDFLPYWFGAGQRF
jgi:hypothetical protein